MIRQPQIFPGGKACGGVGIGGDALIFDLFVYDAFIFMLIFLYDLFHLRVMVIRSVCKAELPVGGGLVHKGIQKIPQVFFRGIIQRRKDADGGQTTVFCCFACHLLPLCRQHLFGGQVPCPLAKAAALYKACAPPQHGGQTLFPGELHRIASKFSGTFQSQIHGHASPRCTAL